MARPRKFDEAQVLEAVRDEFWAKGYTATSLDDLMKATGLGKGSLYGAFGDKHQLFLKVLSIYAGERVAGVHEALSGEGSAIERLWAAFDVPEPSEGDAPEAERGCLLANSSTELAALDDEVLACARKTYQAVEDLLVDTVAQAVAAGDLPADTVPRDLGRLLLAVQQGVEFLSKTGMTPAALRQVGRSAAAGLLR